jgi:phosphatidylserine/phosphatidylglycerophosphate/cardiolipin synthase-like enzyme
MDLINKAKTSLLVESMEMRDTDVRNAIKAKKAAGLDVRALVPDPAWISASTMDAQWYASAGVPVKYFKQYDLHAKLIVADDIALIGSENYTYTSLEQNREIGMLVTEATPMAAAKAQFEADWNVGVAAP